MDEKVRERLLKVLALAERGVGGEQETAQRQLETMLAKYGLTVEEFKGGEERRELQGFRFKGEWERELCRYVILSVLDDWDAKFYTHQGDTNQYMVYLTRAEAAEVKFTYAVYKKALGEAMTDFFTAFILKHDIRPSPKEDAQDNSDPEWLDKIRNMANSLDDVQIHKAIEDKKDE